GVSIISPFWMEKLGSSKLVRSALATLGSYLENMKEISDIVDLYKKFCLHAKAAMEYGALMDQIYRFYIMALYACLAQKSEYTVLSHSLAFSHSVEALFSQGLQMSLAELKWIESAWQDIFTLVCEGDRFMWQVDTRHGTRR